MITSNKLRQRNKGVCAAVSLTVILTLVATVLLLTKFRAKNDDDDVNENVPHSKPFNILFIIADDLRPALSCYGNKVVKSPNIDQIASRGILFNNAYSQQALCAPSRTSLLTSRRPDTTRIYDNRSYRRREGRNFTTIPQYFKENGYYTVSVGKVFHPGSFNSSAQENDYPYSWTEFPYIPPTEEFKNEPECFKDGRNESNLICPVSLDSVEYHTLPDIQNTEYAVNILKAFNDSHDEPFFLAVGYYKPHIPFKFPKEYLDLYPLENIKLAANRNKSESLPDVAWNPWMDIRSREDVKKLNISLPFGPLPDDFQKYVLQSYYASVSYIDDQIGKLLQALEDGGHSKDTIIVLLGDHGWSLGEHQEWAKYSNFDIAVKVPLIMYVPFLTDQVQVPFIHLLPGKDGPSVHMKTDEFVELVDIFPTLTDITGISHPNLCPVNSTKHMFCTEGISLKPLIEHYSGENKFIVGVNFSWKKAVFSQYPRPSEEPRFDSDQPSLKNITIMGYSIRTSEYKYIRWIKFNPVTFEVDWLSHYAEELYDLTKDSEENENVAHQKSYENVMSSMFTMLKEGWRKALPVNYAQKHLSST